MCALTEIPRIINSRILRASTGTIRKDHAIRIPAFYPFSGHGCSRSRFLRQHAADLSRGLRGIAGRRGHRHGLVLFGQRDHRAHREVRSRLSPAAPLRRPDHRTLVRNADRRILFFDTIRDPALRHTCEGGRPRPHRTHLLRHDKRQANDVAPPPRALARGERWHRHLACLTARRRCGSRCREDWDRDRPRDA